MPKVFVICGHGAGDPGACAGGLSEAGLVRRLAGRMEALGGAEVQVADKSRNWYADNGIGRGHCPKGVPVIELHMDSASPAARGGHIIIKAGFTPDGIDDALAAFIGGFMPGRSKAIVGRSDLANPNRAAAMGVNYRLLECGFISNGGDRSKFLERMDDLARGILAAFGVGARPAPAPAPQPQPAPKPQAPDIDRMARDVIAGKYGSGEERKRALGGNYAAVQARVNQILSDSKPKPAQGLDAIARAVIRGEYGNGADRERRLRAAGYDPAAVQRRVNQLL